MFIISIFLFSISEKAEIRSDLLGKSKRFLKGISSLSKSDKRSNGPNSIMAIRWSCCMLIILSSLWDYVLRNSVCGVTNTHADSKVPDFVTP